MSSNGHEDQLADLSQSLRREGTLDAAQAGALRSLIKDVDALTGHRQALVRTAVELTAEERQRLSKAITERFGSEHEVVFELDPSLIGGVWLRVDDRIIDGSLRGRLEALRKQLATVRE